MRHDKSDQWSAANYAANARFVSELGEPVVDWLAPEAGERMLLMDTPERLIATRMIAFRNE